jgi:hypothetical protein
VRSDTVGSAPSLLVYFSYIVKNIEKFFKNRNNPLYEFGKIRQTIKKEFFIKNKGENQ